jgi:hypothetical protein
MFVDDRALLGSGVYALTNTGCAAMVDERPVIYLFSWFSLSLRSRGFELPYNCR